MLLTISIPTYKRPELLHKCLIEIFQQIYDKPNVAVYIADDSDGSENKKWIEKAIKQHPQAIVNHVINKQNLGIDENIKNCIVSPETEYVWLLGEDDLLMPGAIDTVLRVLSTDRPSFVFANYIYCNDDHTKISSNPVLTEYSGITREEFNTFAKKNIWAVGFIGSCIIKKDEWCNQDVGKFTGSYYSHVGGIIDSSFGKEMLIISDILVLNRSENINTFTWSSSTFPVYFSFFNVLNKSKLSSDEELLEQAKLSSEKLFSINSIVWLAAKRADGVYNMRIYKEYYASRPNSSKLFKFLAFLFAAFPKAPLKILRQINLSQRFSTSASTILKS